MSDLALHGSRVLTKPTRQPNRARAEKTYNAARPQHHRLREVTTLSNLPEWQDHAACKGKNSDLFFPGRGESLSVAAAAKQICADCPVTAECLDFGLTQAAGIWGGQSERERRAERARRRLEFVIRAADRFE